MHDGFISVDTANVNSLGNTHVFFRNNMGQSPKNYPCSAKDEMS